MSFQEVIAYLKGSVLHLVIVVIGVVSAWVLVGKFKSGELSFGGGAVKEEIVKKEDEIKSLEKRLGVARERVAKREEMNQLETEIGEMETELKELSAANLASKGRLASINEGLVETEEMFQAYRERYRKHVRDKAVGTKMEELTTIEGKTYKKVEIKSVGALGLNITHSDGSRRIPFKELPPAMQRQFQFDEEEAEAQKKMEEERRRQHRLAQAAALRAAEKAGLENPDHSKPDKPKMSEAEMERAMANLRNAIERLERRIAVADANLRIESAKKVSRAPQFRAELQRLRAAKKANEDKLRDLRSMR